MPIGVMGISCGYFPSHLLGIFSNLHAVKISKSAMKDFKPSLAILRWFVSSTPQELYISEELNISESLRKKNMLSKWESCF